MREREQMLPVWFFIGMLLFIYGIIILITALGEWSHPPDVVLSRLHPGVWGGLILLAIGGFYTVRFRPRKTAGRSEAEEEEGFAPVRRGGESAQRDDQMD